jgi:hypothetical protein
MSLTTHNQKSCSLLALEKKETQAAFYTAYFEPKTQTAAIKLIYGVKSTSNTNFNPITDARGNLLENKFVVNLTPNKQRNAVFKSTVAPIIDYIKTRDSEEHSSVKSNSEYYRALERIIDSDWFRGFFSSNILLEDWDHFTSRYHVYRFNLKKTTTKNRSKLSVTSSVGLFTNLMSDIAACSWELTKLLRKHNWEIPTVKQIIEADSFDSIIDKNREKLPNELVDMYFDSLTFSDDKDPNIFSTHNDIRSLHREFPFLPKKISDQMKKGSMFIPTTVSARMRSSGRVPITVMEKLPEVVSNVEKHSKQNNLF